MLSQFPVEREVIIIYFWTKDPDLEQPINSLLEDHNSFPSGIPTSLLLLMVYSQHSSQSEPSQMLSDHITA